MKKVLVLAALAALVSTSAMAAVTGTAHDFSNTGGSTYATDAKEVCVFCHTPHGATTSTSYVPLWNRTASVLPTGFYNSQTIQSVVSAPITESTDAYLCLSCHDGATAVETLNNAPNSGLGVGGGVIIGDADLGVDMSNDHPIGFNYATTQALDSELVAVASLPAAIKFFGGEMWCSTCHDVHGGVLNTPFLAINNDSSNLCLACHTK